MSETPERTLAEIEDDVRSALAANLAADGIDGPIRVLDYVYAARLIDDEGNVWVEPGGAGDTSEAMAVGMAAVIDGVARQSLGIA